MKNRLSASFTIEMAVVMPLVLYTILALIFLSFCLHDRCKIQAAADRVLHTASLYLKHEGDIVNGEIKYENINSRGFLYMFIGDTTKECDEIKEYLARELGSGLLCTSITDIRVKAGKLKIELEVSGRFKLPVSPIISFLNRDISIRAESPVHNPAEVIRISEVILETGEKIKGVSELKKKLQEIMP